jgi:uncharacterized membrane protein
MRTPASIAGHPVHPMLVPLAIGLWLFSLACDLVRIAGATSSGWEVAAYYTIIGGIVGALAAAVPGMIDLLSLPRRLRRIALLHMAVNLAVVALYVLNAWLRARGAIGAGVWLSAIGVAGLGFSGWLGGKLVYEHGVGVDTGTPVPAGAPPQSAAGTPPRMANGRRG